MHKLVNYFRNFLWKNIKAEAAPHWVQALWDGHGTILTWKN